MSKQQGFANSGYVQPMMGDNPQQTGYPGQQFGAYPPQQPGAYPPQQPGAYPPQQSVAQNQGQYPPQPAGAYPSTQQPQQGGWDPAQSKQYEGEMPDQDVDENTTAQPADPSAPPPVDAVLPGYENVAYASDRPAGPPPAYTDAINDTRIDSTNIPSITVEDAKDALKEYVSQQCCYGSGAANDMTLKDIKSSSAYHYTLETFTEARSTKWHYEPFSGGMVDGPNMGPAPGPWDIVCSFTQAFQNEVKKLEVPHTAFVKPCHNCFARGFERCWRCKGRGKVRCSSCSGKGWKTEFRDGRQENVNCSFCHGSGRKRCSTCFGNGCIRCRTCIGFGQIKQFIQLTIAFTNRHDKHVVERTMLPDELICNAEGDMISEQIAVRVGPIVGFMENEINQHSHHLVQKHATAWPAERIIQQRQKLRSVPVYECDFEFNNEMGKFWVYGKQRSVYTNDYPHTCCCCKCTIL